MAALLVVSKSSHSDLLVEAERWPCRSSAAEARPPSHPSRSHGPLQGQPTSSPRSARLSRSAFFGGWMRQGFPAAGPHTGGSLVLMFGQHVSRIVALTTGRLGEAGVHVTLRRRHPEPPTRLTRRPSQAAHRRTATARLELQRPQYLPLPWQAARRPPIHRPSCTRSHHTWSPHPGSRTTALIQLAQDMPPAVSRRLSACTSTPRNSGADELAPTGLAASQYIGEPSKPDGDRPCSDRVCSENRHPPG